MENLSEKYKMQDIYNNCRTRLTEFEIWPGYYKNRYEEFAQYCTIFPKQSFGKTLEIGCGIGYQASFLSVISDKVFASDVDFGNMIQHSRGLDITHKFIKQTGIQNIEIANANAESLPFDNEQFDFIYCSYSFQYIPDKDKALKEIRRVLKKDGYFFCVLPTTVYRLKAFKNYYKAIFKKLFTTGTFFNSKPNGNVENIPAAKKKLHTKLLPPPDDDNNSFFNELFLYSPIRWTRLFKKNGHKIVRKKHSAFIAENSTTGVLRGIKEKLTSDGIILITMK